MHKLAIHGGKPVRSAPFPHYNTIGAEEKKAVMQVLDSGILSDFLGAWSPQFHGGPVVQAAEKEWSQFFNVKHSISMNSATSGLFAAAGALGLGPQDEVLVPPYTMSATAAAILAYSAIPVFVDIDPENFCIDPNVLEASINKNTKAIYVVHLFGYCADMKAIMQIARKHNLKVVEDCAQAPASKIDGQYVGTFGDIGVFSLNYHKTIHSGEGAMLITNNDDLAMRLKLIRNHAEVVIPDMPNHPGLNNMLGFNYRMTEMEAAVTREQLKKLTPLVTRRTELLEPHHTALQSLPFIRTHRPRAGTLCGYYVFPITYDAAMAQVPRHVLVKAIQAEGIPLAQAYVKPIYLQPLYQQRILYGGTKWPFEFGSFKSSVSYAKGICPVTERLHEESLIFHRLTHAQLQPQDIQDISNAFEKVLTQIDTLRG